MQSEGMRLSEIIVLPVQTGFQVRRNVQISDSGNYSLIQMKDATSSLLYQINSRRLSRFRVPDDKQKFMQKYMIQKDDVLFLSRLNFGAFRYVDDMVSNTVPMSHFYILRPKLDFVDPEYLCWALNQDFMKPDIFRNIEGSVLPFISKDALKKLRVPIPDIDIQKKIVTLLNLRRQEKEKEKIIDKKKDILMNAVLTKLVKG